MNAERAIALIKENGIFGLGESDGCWCCHFEVQGVTVAISCRKSEHCIRVISEHLYREAEGLEQVARCILDDSLKRYDKDYSGFRLRFCAYRRDHSGEHGQCCYCGKPRSSAEAYLCDKCLLNPEATTSFPWTSDGFLPGSMQVLDPEGPTITTADHASD